MILTDKFLVGQKTLKHVAIGLLEELAELLDLCVAGRFARLQTLFRDFFEVSAAFQTQSVCRVCLLQVQKSLHPAGWEVTVGSQMLVTIHLVRYVGELDV